MSLNGAGVVGSDVVVKVSLQGCWEFWCLGLEHFGAGAGFNPLCVERLEQGSWLFGQMLIAGVFL